MIKNNIFRRFKTLLPKPKFKRKIKKSKFRQGLIDALVKQIKNNQITWKE